jgi:hypothetical protein
MITPLLTLVLLATPARGEALLARAQAQLAAADYEPVAATLAPLLEDTRATPTLRARAEVLVGLARHNLLDEAGAEQAFARALVLDPRVTLPAEASPRTAAVFQRVAARSTPAVEPGARTPPAVAARPEVERTGPLDPGGPHLEAPTPLTPVAPPDPRWAPRPWLALGGVVAAAALTTTGLVLRGAGSAGRDAADAEREALVAEARWSEAQDQYSAGTALAVAGAATAAAALILWLWPEDGP